MKIRRIVLPLICFVAIPLAAQLPNGVAAGDVTFTSAVLWAKRIRTFRTSRPTLRVRVAKPARVDLTFVEVGRQSDPVPQSTARAAIGSPAVAPGSFTAVAAASATPAANAAHWTSRPRYA